MSGEWWEVCELAVDPDRALVHIEGWQSWTPTTTYRLDDRQFLPRALDTWVGNYGGSRPRPPAGVFQGDGLLVIDPGAGTAVVAVGALAPDAPIPCVRLERVDATRVRVTADAPAVTLTVQADGGIAAGTAAFAERFASAAKVGALRAAPSAWCTWYRYLTELRATDVLDNLDAITTHHLPVDVVLIDDGFARAPVKGSVRSEGPRRLSLVAIPIVRIDVSSSCLALFFCGGAACGSGARRRALPPARPR